ncbi:uncharacterized protein LOC125240571 [Leguminivora glycinivorella]|uniref:uncharacterized protein LOC125240571 n=1 Tax=Leguminivora glycinivorella TaxID=1035111 RepID=UPI00200F97E1|nr:uncharacterized protein LOC125240571 [Leguminivora glycinivorella]
MHCIWKLAFVLSVLYLVENNASSIRIEDVSTKDVPVPKDDKNLEVEPEIPEVLEVDAVANKIEETSTRQCVEIGSFCINHSECCSNTCLGYRRRCVSGSG